jgi:hypothetical protein
VFLSHPQFDPISKNICRTLPVDKSFRASPTTLVYHQIMMNSPIKFLLFSVGEIEWKLLVTETRKYYDEVFVLEESKLIIHELWGFFQFTKKNLLYIRRGKSHGNGLRLQIH